MSNFLTVVIYTCISFWLIGSDITTHPDLSLGTKLSRESCNRHLCTAEILESCVIDKKLQDSALSKPFSHIGFFWKPRTREINIKAATRSQRAPVRGKRRKRSITKSSNTTEGSIKSPNRKTHIKRQSVISLRQKCAYPTCNIQGSYGVLDNSSTQSGISTNSSSACSRKLFCR